MEENNLLRRIHQYYKTSNRFYIGNRFNKWYLYKYMTISSFKKCISFPLKKKEETILFCEPSCWPDQFEQRFYLADYSDVNLQEEVQVESVTPKVYACCFTYNSDSDAAWKVYSNKDLGAEGLCVKIKINRSKLSQELSIYAKENFKLYEGPVNYNLSEFDIFHLHEKILPSGKPKQSLHPNKWYSLMFGNYFTLDNYLSLLLLKRKAFDYEKEFRYFLIEESLSTKKNNEKIYPKINWAKIIERIEVDEQYPNDDFEDLRYFCTEKLKLKEDKITKKDINVMPGGKIKIQKP